MILAFEIIEQPTNACTHFIYCTIFPFSAQYVVQHILYIHSKIRVGFVTILFLCIYINILISNRYILQYGKVEFTLLHSFSTSEVFEKSCAFNTALFWTSLTKSGAFLKRYIRDFPPHTTKYLIYL